MLKTQTTKMKMIKLLISVELLIGSLFSFGQDNKSTTDTLPKKISFLFAGDIMGHGPQFRAAWDSTTDTYDYAPCFKFVKHIVSSADIAIANLEVNFGGKPYSGYPTFSSPDALAGEIKNTGFDILAMANNHCYDKGKQGFERTINLLDSLKIPHLGTYINNQKRDSAYPMMIEKNGIKFALLNYTYSTNGIKPDTPSFVNYIKRDQIVADIAKADSLKANCIIAFMHWGNEYELVPNTDQRNLAQFLAQKGVDIIIGSHPHVVQTFELLHPDSTDSTKVVPVFYSLGNFISNQRDRYRNGGAMFYFEVEKGKYCRIINYNYIPYWVYKGILKGKYQYYIIPLALFNPENIILPEEDKNKLLEFSSDIKQQFPNLKENENIKNLP